MRPILPQYKIREIKTINGTTGTVHFQDEQLRRSTQWCHVACSLSVNELSKRTFVLAGFYVEEKQRYQLLKWPGSLFLDAAADANEGRMISEEELALFVMSDSIDDLGFLPFPSNKLCKSNSVRDQASSTWAPVA